MRIGLHRACLGLALAFAAAGCGGSSNNNNTNTDLSGQTLTGALDNGAVVTLQVASASQALTAERESAAAAATTLHVTGTLTLPGGAQGSLTGTYDPAAKTFTVSGTIGSQSFSLSGSFANGALNGTWTSGSSSGSFVAFQGGTSTVTRYCGTYSGDSSGYFMVVVSGGTARAAVSSDSGGFVMTGTAGSSISLSGNPGDGTVTATGTVAGTAVSGTWTHSGGGQGTWTGGTALCP